MHEKRRRRFDEIPCWLFPAVKEEHRTAFFGEDIYIGVPPGNVGEVVFIPANQSSDQVVLMRAGQVVPTGQVVQTSQGLSPRYRVISRGYLVLEDVKEEDEGTYVVKKTNESTTLKRLVLIVRGKRRAALCPLPSKGSGTMTRPSVGSFSCVEKNHS